MGPQARLRGRIQRQGRRQRRAGARLQHRHADRRHARQRGAGRQREPVYRQPDERRPRRVQQPLPEPLRVQARPFAAEPRARLGPRDAAVGRIRILGAQPTVRAARRRLASRRALPRGRHHDDRRVGEQRRRRGARGGRTGHAPLDHRGGGRRAADQRADGAERRRARKRPAGAVVRPAAGRLRDAREPAGAVRGRVGVARGRALSERTAARDHAVDPHAALCDARRSRARIGRRYAEPGRRRARATACGRLPRRFGPAAGVDVGFAGDSGDRGHLCERVHALERRRQPVQLQLRDDQCGDRRGGGACRVADAGRVRPRQRRAADGRHQPCVQHRRGRRPPARDARRELRGRAMPASAVDQRDARHAGERRGRAREREPAGQARDHRAGPQRRARAGEPRVARVRRAEQHQRRRAQPTGVLRGDQRAALRCVPAGRGLRHALRAGPLLQRAGAEPDVAASEERRAAAAVAGDPHGAARRHAGRRAGADQREPAADLDGAGCERDRGRRRRDRRAALTARRAAFPAAGWSSGFFFFGAGNRFGVHSSSTGPRCNKLLLYGPKPRFYYSPRFSLNLINYLIGDISFQIVIRSFRFY
ncbi:hypothetical protein BVI1335_1730002 [Burkholderia vietnamiensis]|nr:hypothetical protein BVI1335_1730002 [Burkholderia vietnamiensis]